MKKITILIFSAALLILSNISFACSSQNLTLKFSDAKEFVSKLPQSIELKSDQSIIIEAPENEAQASWTAFIDYASSPNAGTPKKPKLEITFFDKSKQLTKDPNQVRYILISVNQDINKADVIIAFLHQSKEKNETLDTVLTRVKVIQRKTDSPIELRPKC